MIPRQYLISLTGALLLLSLIVLAPSWSSLPVAAGPAATPTSVPGLAVRIAYSNKDQVKDLLDHGVDVWEVRKDHVIAWVTPDQRARLSALSLQIQDLPQQPQPGPNGAWPPYPACYRTYDEMTQLLGDTVAAYPDIAERFDVGDSWEKTQIQADRDLWVLRLTDETVPAPKPRFFLVAEHHARELVTPKVAMNYIEYLVSNHDVDADVTALLREREIWVMPMANPDGHAKVEEHVNWRKNTNTSNSCLDQRPPDSYGVDLNRNYGYEWGHEDGSSSDPCHLDYRGPTPFSEPETWAIRRFVRSQRFNLLISLHSFSDLILYPWGYTDVHAPDFDGLHAIAAKMASYNGYKPQQSSQLYPTSGDTVDWAYGELDIPSFTFEIGSGSEGFFWPDCDTAEDQWQENLAPLLLAAKIADAPYTRARGPEATGLNVARSSSVVLQATLSDNDSGRQSIAAAEYFVDSVGADGTGTGMSASDGRFDDTIEQVAAVINTDELSAGRHLVLVRGQDSAGYWGPSTASFLDVAPTPVAPSVTATLTPSPSSTSTPTPTSTPTAMPPSEQSVFFLPLVHR